MIFLLCPDIRALQCCVFSTPRSLSSCSVALQSLHWTLMSCTWCGQIWDWEWELWGNIASKYCRLWQRRRFPQITPGWWTCLTSCWPWQPPANFSFWLLMSDLGKKAGSQHTTLLSGWEFPGCSTRRQESQRATNPARRDGEVQQFIFISTVDLNIYYSDWKASPRENSIFTKISGGCQFSLFSIHERISEKTSSLVCCVSRKSWWQAPG